MTVFNFICRDQYLTWQIEILIQTPIDTLEFRFLNISKISLFNDNISLRMKPQILYVTENRKSRGYYRLCVLLRILSIVSILDAYFTIGPWNIEKVFMIF